MTFSKMPGMRAAILGSILILTLAVGVPYMVTAQDASPQASPAGETDPLLARGGEIFSTVCIACHQPDGKGIEGIYLPLAGNPAVTLEDPTYLITVILNGRGGMPRFDSTFDDEEIASIATYVRQTWGNAAPAVTVEQVAAVRANYQVSAVTTPEGQIPSGSGLATPEGTPEASPAG
jgi:mono/diheme cytochrome c family protein